MISVVLPVYNCPEYVGQAIESILAQTFSEYELLIIDDGSTDETPSVLARYKDHRLRLFTQSNRGLAATLNRGIELARGQYIARQDQDDISYPDRFAKQIAFFEAHPNCALLGTWAEIWRGNSKSDRQHKHPSENALLHYELLLNNPFVHSSVMIRRLAIDHVGPYCTDSRRQPPEDFELWSRIARLYEVANIPEVLHIYREVPGSMSRDGSSPFLDHLVTITAENIAWAAQTHAENPHVINIAALAHRAAHRVVGVPDFRAMSAVFARAARRVADKKHERQITGMAEDLIHGMRYEMSVDNSQSPLGRLLPRIKRKMSALLRRRNPARTP